MDISKKYSNPIKVPRFEEANGFYTTPQRSKQMSRIRGKNPKTEVALRKALWNVGVRYRIGYKSLPGKPDIVITKYKLVVFVDGEFWHGKNWEEKKEQIKSNKEFWLAKIERNIQRDEEVNEELRMLGYSILRFWEGEVENNIGAAVKKVLDTLSLLSKLDIEVE